MKKVFRILGLFAIGTISLTLSSISAEENLIPQWVKNNAIWWGNGQISDSEFMSALQFLINSNQLKIPDQMDSQTEEEIDSLKNLKENHQKSSIDLKEENNRLESLIAQYKENDTMLRSNNDETYTLYLEEYERSKQNYQAYEELREEYAKLYDEYLYYYNLSTGSGNLQYEQPASESSSKSTSTSSNSQNCSGNARCITGTVTQVIDGDTIKVDGESIRFALASAPELDEFEGIESRELIDNLCSVGSKAIVDEDDMQTQGSYGRIIGVIYCNGYNLNEELVESGLGCLSSGFCNSSEFATQSWAQKHGC